jgi:hypothetical protein
MSRVRTVAWSLLFSTTFAAGVRGDGIASDDSWLVFARGDGGWKTRSGYVNVFNVTVGSGGSAQNATPAPGPPSIPATPSFNPVASTISSAPVSAPDNTTSAFSSSVQSTSGPSADAFLNFGTSNFPEQSTLTTGNAQPWYTSPSVTKFFGGNSPTSVQQAQFTQQVLQDAQQTFAQAGMHPNITLDPNVHANHTLSEVSGASYGPNSNAIGITDVGLNGFGFIDKLSYASSLTDLQWAVAHNISHELMHAFGVGYHPDDTGKYIDAGTATWSVLTDPNTTFSPAAATAIQATNFGNYATTTGATGAEKIDGDQQILSAPVPEPSTIAIWSVALTGFVAHRRSRVSNRRKT